MYRGGWRAEITLANGKRPFGDFESLEKAKGWISAQLANGNSGHDPELDGPTEATAAQELGHYAGLYTVTKQDIDSEPNRINSYLIGAAMKLRRKTVKDDGKVEV